MAAANPVRLTYFAGWGLAEQVAPGIAHDEAAVHADERLLGHAVLESELAVVVADADGVGERAERALDRRGNR